MKPAHPKSSPADGLLTGPLRRHAQRWTGPRAALLNLLRRNRRPLSCRELHERLRSDRCDLATVYRSIHLLTRAGLVKRFDLGDGVARFQLVSIGPADGHHHHLICRRCSESVELDACLLPGLNAAVGARHGFQQVEHRLEFFGLCPACQ